MPEKLKIKEAIVVEGRYDKNTLSQIVDTVILETGGFGVFKNAETMKLLRFYAEKRGLIILTDSDGAGFVIRNRLKGSIPGSMIKHAYVPDIIGKEKRKKTASREGKLGVEGMERSVLENALLRAGATVEDRHNTGEGTITGFDMYSLGFKGGPDSREKRADLCHRLDLPQGLSAGALLDALNTMGLSPDDKIFDAYRQ